MIDALEAFENLGGMIGKPITQEDDSRVQMDLCTGATISIEPVGEDYELTLRTSWERSYAPTNAVAMQAKLAAEMDFIRDTLKGLHPEDPADFPLGMTEADSTFRVNLKDRTLANLPPDLHEPATDGLEDERIVLNAMMRWEWMHRALRGVLQEENFRDEAHGLIFDATWHLVRDRLPLTTDALAWIFRDHPSRSEDEGRVYLAEIEALRPDVAEVMLAAIRVRDTAQEGRNHG